MPTIAAYDAILFIEHLMPLPMMAHVEMNLEEKILNAAYDAILVNWALDIYDATAYLWVLNYQAYMCTPMSFARSAPFNLYYSWVGAQFQTAGREEKGLAFSTAYDLYYCYLWI